MRFGKGISWAVEMVGLASLASNGSRGSPLVGAPLAGKLPPNFLDRTAAVRDEVDKAMQDKTVSIAESRQATNVQNQCQRDGKVWVRGVGKRCQSGIQLGVNLPHELGKVSSPATVPGMLEQMSKTLSLLTKHTPDMEKIGMPVQTHIDEGRKIFEALQKADSAQERAHSADIARGSRRLLCEERRALQHAQSHQQRRPRALRQ